MSGVEGVITSTSPLKVRKGRKLIEQSAGFQLPPKQTVEVTGFGIDPRGDQFKHRYQININDEPYWITASYADVALADATRIPYVPAFPDDPLRELKEGLGISMLNSSTPVMDDVVAIARFLPYMNLRGNNWDGTQIAKLRGWLEQLYSYGVILASPTHGGWSLSEIESAFNALNTIAAGTDQFLQAAYGISDPTLAFRILYAPLVVTRMNRDNVNNSDAVWFAKNVYGYEVVFGNRVFFNGKQKTKLHPQQPFTTVELIAHEVSHVINYRYRLLDPKNVEQEVDDYYNASLLNTRFELPDGEIVKVSGDSGFAFVSRSSDHPAEIVTDHIAATSLGRLTVGDANPTLARFGQVRQIQLTDVMRRVVQWAVENYTDLDGVKAKIARARVKNPALADMTPALSAVAGGEETLDQQMARLKAMTPVM
ncbi:MAG: hypothetical protein R3E39_21530 [Anaerolineae bacterium]